MLIATAVVGAGPDELPFEDPSESVLIGVTWAANEVVDVLEEM